MSLYLLPNVLGAVENSLGFLPKNMGEIISKLNGLIAESEKGGRHFLRLFVTREQLDHIPIILLNEHTMKEEREGLLKPILRGENWGLISDCGLPCLADPGSHLVSMAYDLNIDVKAIVGPSSIVMALMLSGFSGQRFAFHGYIAREEEDRKKELKKWEKRAKEEEETQIFMETPYRNLSTFQSILEVLDPSIKLCIAWNLTLREETVMKKSIRKWRESETPLIHKQPAIFLFSSF